MLPEPIKVLQLSDTHLYADKAHTLLGMNTQASFNAVLDDVKTKKLQPDFLLLTGDLSQDSSAAAYQRLTEEVKFLHCPAYWIPGNHDDPELMQNVFAKSYLQNEKVIIKDPWQIILLNSHKPGAVEGFLNSQQLHHLTNCLEKQPNLYSLIVLHHHVTSIDCKWIDPYDLHNRDEFLTILNSFPKVRVILCGHIHQELDVMLNKKIRFLATPSTCIQFKPKTEKFALDLLPPGYRWLELNDDGSINTKVYRAENFAVTIDTTANRY